MRNVFKSGPFAGIPLSDAFAQAAQGQSPIIYRLPAISWPENKQPTTVPLGKYAPGTKITSALSLSADVLIILFTDQETMALLDVMTGSSSWGTPTKADWCPYAHNFDKFKSLIANPKANDTLAAGAIGSRVNCGDVTVCTSARLHCQHQYPHYPDIATLTANATALTTPSIRFDPQYVQYAATHLTSLSLPGLAQCYQRLQAIPGYTFVQENALPPSIYLAGVNPVPGPEPMAILSADYMTTDDTSNAEQLQALGIMNDTDDAFVFFAINQMPAAKRPPSLSVRNASEPQVEHSPFPSSTSQAQIIDILKTIAGTIYGIYQYCTTLNSAFACWGIVAGL